MWKPDPIGIFLGLACIVLILFTFHLYQKNDNSTAGFGSSLTDIEKCIAQKDFIACSRPVIDGMLQTKTGGQILDALQTRLDPQNCHYVGHVVGQELYLKVQHVETALDECNRDCDSACIHGVVGEAFAQELGLGSPDQDTAVDLEHLSKTDIETIGKKLCTSPEACHGVGHTIFQTTGTIPSAMSECEKITPTSSRSCFAGAAMEYADILSDRSARNLPGVTFPSLSSLPTLCTSLPYINEQRSCFRYFPRIMIQTLLAQGQAKMAAYDQVLQLCSTYNSDDDRVACFAGIGAYNAYLVLTDPSGAVQACDAITSPQDEAACYWGETDVAVEERQTKLIAHCADLPNEQLQAACYRETFYDLNALGESRSDAAKLCDPSNALCETGFQDYKVDPWSAILNDFKL